MVAAPWLTSSYIQRCPNRGMLTKEERPSMQKFHGRAEDFSIVCVHQLSLNGSEYQILALLSISHGLSRAELKLHMLWVCFFFIGKQTGWDLLFFGQFKTKFVVALWIKILVFPGLNKVLINNTTFNWQLKTPHLLENAKSDRSLFCPVNKAM